MDSPPPDTLLVTGIGSMPGTDSAEATRIVAGEFDVPHLVELPARGPGGDMIGRTLALVAAATGEFPVLRQDETPVPAPQQQTADGTVIIRRIGGLTG